MTVDAHLTYEGREVTFCDVDPTGHIGNCLLNVCWYEIPNLEFIRGLGAGGGYVDVGAYIGTHAIYFSLFCAADQVYAFEPKRSYFDVLTKNIAANGVTNCTTFNLALLESADATMPVDEYEIFPVATLDSMQLADIRVLKIDTENAELRVLQGAADTLATVEHLFVEIWPQSVCTERRVDNPMQAITDLAARYGLTPQGRLPWEDLWYFAKEDRRRAVELAWLACHGRLDG